MCVCARNQIQSTTLTSACVLNRYTSAKVSEPVGNIGLTDDPNILLAALKRAVVLFDLSKQAVVR